MSARAFLAGFAKTVLAHRHAFIASPAQTVDLGRGAVLPESFDEAFGGAVPKDVDAAFAAKSWPAARRRLRAWAKREPERPEPRLLAALLLLWPAPGTKTRADRLEGLIDRCASREGIRALERVARDFPEWTPARLWLALALLRRADLPAAWRELDALCAARPAWEAAFLTRSELARVDIVFDRALADLARAEALAPRDPWIHAFRGRVLFQKLPGAEGEAAMDRAVALAPKQGWIRAWRADARRKLGNLRGASADLAAALKLEPTYDRIYLWWGKVLSAQGKAREAERVFTRGIKAIPHFEKALAERARARLALGRTDEALADLEAAASVNHRHNALWNWTAAPVPLDGARRDVLARLAAHAKSAPRSARAWSWLGESLTQAGLPAEGLIALDQALALEPGRPRLRSWRGEALLRLGRLKEAERELDRAVRADPCDGRARAFRGRVRFLRGGFAAAVADLEKAVADSMVEYSWVYHWRAEAKEASGDRAGARADARTAAALEPGRAEFRALLGRLSRGRRGQPRRNLAGSGNTDYNHRRQAVSAN